jgi:hypothetical protein
MPRKRTTHRLVCAACQRPFVYTNSYTVAFCSNDCRYGSSAERLHMSICASDGAVGIPLLNREGAIAAYTFIDADDVEWVNQWRWHITQDGYARRNVKTGGRYKASSLHRELLGLVSGDGLVADHINRDRLDNRRANLRAVTRKANAQNISPNPGASSSYRGVSWHTDTGKWMAYVGVDGKLKYLGLFQDEREAADVARDARRELLPYAID